jgi:protein-tyrosine kinase
VISPESGDGKSLFLCQSCIALAQLGGRTLLVDADMRSPRQHELFKLKQRRAVCCAVWPRWSQVIQQISGVPSLFVLPVGITPPNPLELLERPAFGLLVRELLSKFDHVVVDTPAASYGADSAVIGSRCGAALVIARKNESKVAALQDLVGTFEQSPAKLVGVIVNEF